MQSMFAFDPTVSELRQSDSHADGAFAPPSQFGSDGLDGIPWGVPHRLTISFAADGTRVADDASTLYRTFGSLLDASGLEQTILKAFQNWARHSNINVGLVADRGDPFGIGGPSQGDRRFGDIRVGAVPMSADVFAVSVRHDELISGTWAGDILFNSNATFTSAKQVFAIALHEAGHVLGLEHNEDPSSVMHPHAGNYQLSQQDIQELRGLYGWRQLDVYDLGDEPNDSLVAAADIKHSGGLKGTIPLIVYGDISRRGDEDYFVVEAKSGYSGSVSFAVVSDGISLLAPSITVYDQAGSVLQQVSSASLRGDILSVTVDDVVEDQRLYIRVTGNSRRSLYSTGSYALVTTFDDSVTVRSSQILQVARGDYVFLEQDDVQQLFLEPQLAFHNDDLHTDDTLDRALQLETIPGFPKQLRYRYDASLSDSTDVDFYRIKSFKPDTAQDLVMTVTLRAMERNGLVPDVRVLDKDGASIPLHMLVNGNGELVVQAGGIRPDDSYYVQVAADTFDDRFARGNYRVEVSFMDPQVLLDSFASGTLSASNPSKLHTLHVAETQMFHLALRAGEAATGFAAIVWATIYDQRGRVVYRAATRPGETRTANSVVLAPGSYLLETSVAFASGGSDTGAMEDIQYSVLGKGISDPIGPKLVNPTQTPIPKCNPDEEEYCYPGGIHSTDVFLWVSGNWTTLNQPSTAPAYVDLNAWYWYEDWLTQDVPDVL